MFALYALWKYEASGQYLPSGGAKRLHGSRPASQYRDVSPRPTSGPRLSPTNELGSPGGWNSKLDLLDTSVGDGDFADEIEAELAAVAAAGAAPLGVGAAGSGQGGPRAGGL